MTHPIWEQQGKTPTTDPPESTNNNTNTPTNLSFLTGTLTGTVDTSTPVSKTQSVFDGCSKAVQYPDLHSKFEKKAKIWDLQ